MFSVGILSGSVTGFESRAAGLSSAQERFGPQAPRAY